MHMLEHLTLSAEVTDTLTRRLGALYAMTILLLLLALVIVIFLLICWRRQALGQWYTKRREKRKAAGANVWKISGARLIRQMDHPQKKSDDSTSEDGK